VIISSSCYSIIITSYQATRTYSRYGVDSIIQAKTCPLAIPRPLPVYRCDSTCSVLLHSNRRSRGDGYLILYPGKFRSGSAGQLSVLPRWQGRAWRKGLRTVRCWSCWFGVFGSVGCRSPCGWSLRQRHMLVSSVDRLIDMCVFLFIALRVDHPWSEGVPLIS
jgi:hypothetical protein